MPVIVRAAGNHSDRRVLDISEKQGLVNVVPAYQGCGWEQHIFFGRVQGSRWVAADTSLVVEPIDVGEDGVLLVPLTRGGRFPLANRPCLVFDDLTNEGLSLLRAQAYQMIDMLGGIPPTLTGRGGDGVWIFADPAHESFSLAVPLGDISQAEGFYSRGSQGAVRMPDVDPETWTAVEYIAPDAREEWLSLKRTGLAKHLPLLGLDRPKSGRLTFAAAVEAITDPETGPMKDKKVITGTVAIRELLTAILQSGLEPPAWFQAFLISTGLHAKAGVAIELQYIVYAIWAMLCVDSLNLPHLVSAEHLARRALQIQKAVRINPKSPDFATLSNYMRHAEAASGVAYVPEFEKFQTELSKSEALVMKANRLVSEEADAQIAKAKAKAKA
jgi:hypothetical protein